MSDRPQDNRMSGARAGAQFYKCAFQVNPHDYAQKYRGRPPEFDEAGYARALIDNAEALDINVLAVTDHNSVNGVDAIRAVARERNIVVFPGFELTAKEGIHVVCLYEPKTSTTQLGRFLGQLGVLDTTGSSDPCAASFSEVLAQVADQGGVTIAAHVTQDNGLLKVLQGQARINAWRDENLLAIQIPGAVDELPNEEKKIVRNRNAHYARKHAPEEALALAVVNAKDVAEPDDLANCSATCFVKMSEVGVEGLRQAFLDPGSRIRLNSDRLPKNTPSSSRWLGKADFSPMRRSTSTPTSTYSLEAVAPASPRSSRVCATPSTLNLSVKAQVGHAGILKHVLRNGTKISLLVRRHRPKPREYRIERTIPNPPIVRDCDTGEVLDVRPSDVFPDVEVYGQHEISELAKSSIFPPQRRLN